MSRFSQLFGTIGNSFQIGISGTGAKVLRFFNGFLGILSWNPTANRTVIIPDTSGTIALLNDFASPPPIGVLVSSPIAASYFLTVNGYAQVNRSGNGLISSVESRASIGGIVYKTSTVNRNASGLISSINVVQADGDNKTILIQRDVLGRVQTVIVS